MSRSYLVRACTSQKCCVMTWIALRPLTHTRVPHTIIIVGSSVQDQWLYAWAFFFLHKKSSISFIARLKKKKRKKKERKFLPNLNKLMQKCVFILVHESLSLSLYIYIYILNFTYSLFKIPFIFIPHFIKTSKFLIFLFFFDTQQLLFALFLHSHNKA